MFQTKQYFDNRLSKFGDLGFNYLQKYDRINSQKIRIQDSQSKKEPENSVFSDFESKYSTFTQLFFKCCTAITQLFTALEIQLSNTAQHTAQHFLYCAVLWGTRFHSGKNLRISAKNAAGDLCLTCL